MLELFSVVQLNSPLKNRSCPLTQLRTCFETRLPRS